MSKNQEPIEAPSADAAPVSKIRFEDCDYTAQQAQQILAVRTTTFFQKVLPQLESYFQGNRRIITGRSILAYRERKLAEPRDKWPTQNLPHMKKRRSRKPKTPKENGATAKARAP